MCAASRLACGIFQCSFLLYLQVDSGFHQLELERFEFITPFSFSLLPPLSSSSCKRQRSPSARTAPGTRPCTSLRTATSSSALSMRERTSPSRYVAPSREQTNVWRASASHFVNRAVVRVFGNGAYSSAVHGLPRVLLITFCVWEIKLSLSPVNAECFFVENSYARGCYDRC